MQFKYKGKLKKIGDRSLTRIETVYETNTEGIRSVIQQIEEDNKGYCVVWIEEVE